MNATFVNADGSERHVWIRLTKQERQAVFNAEIASWVLCWKTSAELMGPELEAIVCGHRPERYVDADWTSQ